MRLIVSLCIVALILVACGGTEAPQDSGNPEGENDTTNISDATPEGFGIGDEDESDNSVVIVTPQAQVSGDTVPLPGTLVFDPEYVDENIDAVFDRIIFVRTGGGESSAFYELILMQDGSYELNREIFGQVDVATVASIDNLLDELNFFGINTPMLGAVPDTDKFRYAITVERSGDELTIRAEDGFIPQEFLRLISALMNVVLNANSTALVTTPSA